MSTTAERIKEAMKIRGLKQSDLVEQTGISKGALSSYLNGHYEPKQNNIYKLADALKVNEAWLMGHDDIEMEKKSNLQINSDLRSTIDSIIMNIDQYPEFTIRNIARICRQQRIDLKLSESTLANRVNIEVDQYVNFEHDYKNIGSLSIVEIMQALFDDRITYVAGFIEGIITSSLSKEEAIARINKGKSIQEIKDLFIMLLDLSDDGRQEVSKLLKETIETDKYYDETLSTIKKALEIDEKEG